MPRRCLAERVAHWDGTEAMRIWVPGCATGEEAAYTVVMVVARAGFPSNLSERIKVFATTWTMRRWSSPGAPPSRRPLVAHLPPDLRSAYIETSGPTVRVASAVKECVVFARHNLAVDPQFLRMDPWCPAATSYLL